MAGSKKSDGAHLGPPHANLDDGSRELGNPRELRAICVSQAPAREQCYFLSARSLAQPRADKGTAYLLQQLWGIGIVSHNCPVRARTESIDLGWHAVSEVKRGCRKAHEIWVFSKTETDRICSEASSWGSFWMMAMTT